MSARIVELEAALGELLGPGIRAGALAVEDALVRQLWDAEAQLVARAVPKRRRELAAGRVLARRLLGELGFADAPLLAGADRAPLWPAGAVGSISHTDELCVVAVARASEVASIGIDLEQRRPLKDGLWSIVLSDAEQAFVRAQTACAPGELAMVIFSAKEAVYKYQYPFTRTLLDFHDVSLTLDVEGGRFEATILHEVGAAVPGPLMGRFRLGPGWIASGLQRPVSG